MASDIIPDGMNFDAEIKSSMPTVYSDAFFTYRLAGANDVYRWIRRGVNENHAQLAADIICRNLVEYKRLNDSGQYDRRDLTPATAAGLPYEILDGMISHIVGFIAPKVNALPKSAAVSPSLS
jgi:hypothetical protein